MFEEQLYISGTGTGKPQGLLGNIGSGTRQNRTATATSYTSRAVSN